MFISLFVNSIWRTLIAVLSFGTPLVFMNFPALENLTIGTIVFFVLHYAEKRILN